MRAHGASNPVILMLHATATACRCGTPSVQEPCLICEQLVCGDCAVFIDPLTRHPVRPSQLMARNVRRDFLAHRQCLKETDTRLHCCVYARDVALMVRILKGGKPWSRAIRG